LSRVLSEVISFTDSIINIGNKVLTEIINAIDSIDRLLPTKMFYETISVISNATKSLPKVFTEVITLSGSLIHEVATTFIEVINVVGTFVIDSISKLLHETISIAEIYYKE
jgi:hypothetical protein